MTIAIIIFIVLIVLFVANFESESIETKSWKRLQAEEKAKYYYLN